MAVNGLQNRENVEEVVRLIEDRGGRALPVLADVSDPDAVDRMVGEVASALGPVDVVVSNAAIRPHKPLTEFSNEEWRKVMSVDLDAAFYLSRAVLPHMVEAGSGSIIAISGLAAFGVRKDSAVVAAAKAGLIGLMRGIAFDYGKMGVRANVVDAGVHRHGTVRPGGVHVGVGGAAGGAGRTDRGGRTSRWCGWACRRRWPRRALFLASDDAGYTTGQTLHVGGGMYME